MGYVKWVFGLIMLGLVVAFFHHYLPSQDVVRVVRTETVRVDVDAVDAQGNEVQRTRDQNRIYTFTADGDERVYRNEDSALYFKFDSSDLQARAESLSKKGALVAVRLRRL